MEDDITVFIQVWLLAVPTALAYSYSLNYTTHPGKRRLLAILPVVLLFVILPLSFSSVHVRVISASLLVWLASFKLLLFSFDKGPLSAIQSNHLSLPAFLTIASLPITIKRDPTSSQKISLTSSAMKALSFALVVAFYSHRQRFHRCAAIAVHSLYSYLLIDFFLAIIAVFTRVILPRGTSLEAQFSAPFLSSSLQDFWGRRWNLVASDILRSAVYYPVRGLFGRSAGVMASFIVSGVMHEVIFFYLAFERPTGEVGLFFLLHGICTVVEISAKKRWRERGMRPLHEALTIPLTIVFVLVSSWWLFMPPIMRAAEKETEDFFSLLKEL